MERLNWCMAQELAKRAEVRIIGPPITAGQAPDNVVVREVPLTPLWRFLFCSQWTAWAEARRWRPDIILGGSALMAPLVWLTAKVANARTAAYVHGLDIAVQHPIYRRAWLPTLGRLDRVIANSRATAKLAIGVGVHEDRISIVHPGVALPERSEHSAVRESFRSEQALTNRTILLSVGRLSGRKGLREFVGGTLPRIVAGRPDSLLLVVGDEPKDALFAESQTKMSIQAVADAHGVGTNIRFLGHVSDQTLSTIYQSSDVHIFPIREIPNDPEGFGMVAVEAAAHGLPTVAYATGGVVDAVSDCVTGRLISPGDERAFADAVLDVLNTPPSTAGMREYAERFSWERFGDDLWASLPVTADPSSANG